jgi:hypothetical protein
MAVEVDSTRKAVSIKWDADAIDAELVDIKAENVATGDVSTRNALPNDGQAVLTYPDDFTGTSHVTIVGWRDDGESGDIGPGVQGEPDEDLGTEEGEIEVA